MLVIIGFCAYCLWRGPVRPFAPCIKKRAKPTISHPNKGELQDPDGILSPDRTAGPNLAFWRRSKASGDWGHQVYLTDLKRQAEAGGSGAGGSGSGLGYDEEAVREANGVYGPQQRPIESLSGNRKSRGMAIGKSRISASPLGAGASNSRHSSPISSTLSHSRLIKPRQSSPASSRSPGPASGSASSSSPWAHPRRVASTILPSPILPPRQSSLYSPASNYIGAPPPRDSMSAVPASGRNIYWPATSINNVANVPPMAKMAYSPFAPRVDNEPGRQGERGQRYSMRGYAV